MLINTTYRLTVMLKRVKCNLIFYSYYIGITSSEKRINNNLY